MEETKAIRSWIGERVSPGAGLRFEDIVLAVMVALVGPVLVAIQGSGGIFDSGRPLDGIIRTAGFLGALACLATRSSDGPAANEPTVLLSASVGPMVGGLMLVGGSGFAALNLDPEVIFGPTFLAVVVLGVAGGHLPAIPTSTRRWLVTLYLIAAATLFWSLIDAIVGGMDIAGEFSRAWTQDAQTTAFVGGALILMAAVYYAMLVYAPRQFVEREGNPLTWLIRFGVFVVGVAFGLGWFAALGV